MRLDCDVHKLLIETCCLVNANVVNVLLFKIPSSTFDVALPLLPHPRPEHPILGIPCGITQRLECLVKWVQIGRLGSDFMCS